jgi:hypothetical protein
MTTNPAEGETSTKQSRDQSTIGFPYGDLTAAISVAEGIMKRGGVPCEPDELAAALGQAPTSGNFRMKVHTARMFGLIATVQGRYQLTDLGFAITDKVQERAAKADAFLQVPLYRRLFDEFRGRQLPPSPAALERTFQSFGVAPKQVERARQAFQRSAQQAGYFDHGSRDRLVRPPIGSATGTASESPAERYQAFEPEPEVENNGGGTGGSGGGRRPPRGLHPFIQGLLDTLPEPNTNWTVEGRAQWLQTAANIFGLLYKGEGQISVKAEKGSGHGG